MFGAVMPKVCMLIVPRRKVVKAKPHSPKGAGLANLRSFGGFHRPGWSSPAKAGKVVPAVLTWARGPKSKWKLLSLGVIVEVFVRVGWAGVGFSSLSIDEGIVVVETVGGISRAVVKGVEAMRELGRPS